MLNRIIKGVFHALPDGTQRSLRSRYVVYKRSSDFWNLRRRTNEEGYTLTSADRLGCIFIHIPKCAGVSLTRALFGTLGGGHLRFVDYQKLYSPQEVESFFMFTIVRNPWDRLASAYFFLKSGGMNGADRQFAETHLSGVNSFEQFVLEWLSPKSITRSIHFQPQSWFLPSKGDARALDFLGYYENLRDDFIYIRDRLRVKAELPVLNKTQIEREDYRTLYTESMIRRVSEVYAEDLALLGYAFDSANLPELISVRNDRLRESGLPSARS